MAALDYPRHFVLLVGAVPRDPLAPVPWWLGFSLSLYMANRRYTPAPPGR